MAGAISPVSSAASRARCMKGKLSTSIMAVRPRRRPPTTAPDAASHLVMMIMVFPAG